jgi:hypothetical protein
MSEMMKIELLVPWGRHTPGEKNFFRPVARDLVNKGMARAIIEPKPKRKGK